MKTYFTHQFLLESIFKSGLLLRSAIHSLNPNDSFRVLMLKYGFVISVISYKIPVKIEMIPYYFYGNVFHF